MSSPIIGGLPAFKADSTLGALEVGGFITTCLFGVTCVQTYLYFRHLKADPRAITLLVCIVWLLDLGHAISVCHVIYTLTITDYGVGILSLFIPPVSISVTILLSVVIGTIEQVWFIRRLYMFSKNIYLAGICAVLALTRFIASMGLTVIAFQRISLSEFGTRFSWLVNCVLTTTAANDVLLAAFLSYCLKRTKDEDIKGSGMSKIINKLIVIAVETGAITSICAVAILVCFLTMPFNAIYMASYGILAKLYTNTFLASLNVRRSFIITFRDAGSLHNGDLARTSTSQADLSVQFRSPRLSNESRRPNWGITSFSEIILTPSILESQDSGSGVQAGSEHGLPQIVVTNDPEKLTESVDDPVNETLLVEMPIRPTTV